LTLKKYDVDVDVDCVDDVVCWGLPFHAGGPLNVVNSRTHKRHINKQIVHYYIGNLILFTVLR
jgi:hypothetical protein